MAFSSFRAHSEVSNQIKVHHTVDSTFLELLIFFIGVTRRVWLRRAISALSLTTGCISLEKTCPSATHQLLWPHHRGLGEVELALTASLEGSSTDIKQGHTMRAWKSHQDLTLLSPKGECTTQWAVHPSAREDSSLLALCVFSVPLHGGGSAQLSTLPPTAPFLSVLLSSRVTFKLQTSDSSGKVNPLESECK